MSEEKKPEEKQLELFPNLETPEASDTDLEQRMQDPVPEPVVEEPKKRSIPKGCFSIGTHTFIYTGRGIYHAGPAAVPAAVALAAYFNRDKGAAFIQDMLDMFPSLKNVFGVRDKGLEIDNTADSIQSKRDQMQVEEAVGKVKPEIDVTSDIDQALDIMREIHEDYASLDARYERAQSSIRTATTRFTNNVGELIMKPVEGTAQMLRLDGIIEKVKTYNAWEAYTVGRPYLDQQARSEMDSLKEQGWSLEQAVEILQARRTQMEDYERYKRVKKDSPGLIEQYQGWLDSVDETHSLQVSLAELTNGYGRMIDEDLRVYLRTRNPEVIERLKAKLSEGKLAEVLSQIQSSQNKLCAEEKKFNEFILRLQALKDETRPAVERLEALKEIYLQAGALREDYNTVGASFPVEKQQQAVEQLDERLEQAQEQTNVEIKTAESNEKYTSVNPDVPELHGIPVSKKAYDIYDTGSIAVTGLLVAGAAYVYAKRAYNKAKNKVLGKD